VKQQSSEFRNSVLWTAVDGIITELKASGEVSINTSPSYVIAYICQELAAKKLVTAAGLRARSGSEGPEHGP